MRRQFSTVGREVCYCLRVVLQCVAIDIGDTTAVVTGLTSATLTPFRHICHPSSLVSLADNLEVESHPSRYRFQESNHRSIDIQGFWLLVISENGGLRCIRWTRIGGMVADG